MDRYDKVKRNQYNTIFFSLKILALFFCATPLFQHFFKSTSKNDFFYELNFVTFFILIGMVLIISFLWLIMDLDRKRLKPILYVEIIVFYLICSISVCLSNYHQSYYKFLFIFMIVSYTIEFGIKIGVGIAVAASVNLLALDLALYDKSADVNPYFQADLALSAMFIVVAWILGYYVKMEKQHIEELTEYANIDGLTEIYNHRYFYEVLGQEFEACKANSLPISLIMMDIDYFKNYNDMYGHQQGDVVLKTIASLLKQNCRNNLVFRYGGEEFCVILPRIGQEEAIKIADRFRQAIYDYEFEGAEHMPDGHITVSIGISELYHKDDRIKDIIGRADDALYRAKFFRKNRVEIYSSIFDSSDYMNKSGFDPDENLKSVKSLISIINSRDRYTYKHLERVVNYCQVFADYVDLSPEDKKRLIYGAYLHDIGKINVSKEILISSRALSPEEWEEMKKHPGDSADIIRQIGGMEHIIPVVLQHHEKVDGSGYPNGLKGSEIHYLAKMLAIADGFDAMTNKRPYQEKRTFEEAFEELHRCKGKHFDKELAQQFIEAVKNMKVAERYLQV